MNYLNKKDLKICTLNINSTIKDVITNLNKSSMQIAIINSQGGNLLGVITDGDIRRGLLRGLDLSSKISSLIKKNPMVIKKNTPSKTVAKGTRHASCDKNMTNNELKQQRTPL